MLRKNSGVTLVALIITIILLVILASTATFTGISAIEDTRISRFRTEMEMMKLQLNSPTELEKYKKTEDDNLTPKQKGFLGEVQLSIKQHGIDIQLDIDGFKYFTKEQIKDISNIEISRDIYINSNTKTIVSGVGVKYNGETYYMLEELPNSLYNVDNNVQNSGNIEFDLSSEKLNITISNIKYNAPYVNKGSIQYKLASDTNWTTVVKDTTSKNFTFEVPSGGEYNVKVIDAKNNESTSNIEIEKKIIDYAKQAMPAGAHIDENTNEETGIVMIDSQENEWVWIEVPKEVFKIAKSSTDYDNIKSDLIEYSKDYREGSQGQGRYWTDEWYAKDESNSNEISASTDGLTSTQKALSNGCGLTYEQYNETYKKMLSSVYTNKGFYISRYEIGDSVATANNILRTETTGSTNKAVSKQNQIPYNFVECNKAQELASTLKTGGKTTSLLFGIQWDLVCKYLEVNENWDIKTNSVLYYMKTDSTSWGNYLNKSLKLSRGMYNPLYSSSWVEFNVNTDNFVINSQTLENSCQLLTTGASEETKKMNIYDFAGNEWEWTLEHGPVGGPCVNRGGSYCGEGTVEIVSFRNCWNIGYKNTFLSFRASLY